jgi:lipopolysaccharide export LptBFGC system permease protein LptF
MSTLPNSPLAVFVVSLVVLWLSAWVGAYFRKRRRRAVSEEDHQDYGVVEGATLTLLGLIIGFSFSMAISRYDQRKNYEEAEANAIGTEYVRIDLLPAADAAKVRALLRDYINQRILFYNTRDASRLRQINADTARLQANLWSTVRGPAAAQPAALTSFILSGMNDVLNSQGYTQAAWWNRIPRAAWTLMAAIGICCNLLIGYCSRRIEARPILFVVVPLVVAISFSLIADIDSPRGGVIRVAPQNLVSLAQSLPPN